MNSLTKKKQFSNGLVFALFLGVMPILPGCGGGGGGAGSGGGNSPPPPPQGIQFQGFSPSQTGILQTLVGGLAAGISAAQINGITQVQEVTPTTQNPIGSVSLSGATMNIYGDLSLDNPGVVNAFLTGVGENVYNSLSADLKAQAGGNATAANRFFHGAGLPQVTAQQFFGQNFASYVNHTETFLDTTNQAYISGQYSINGRVIPIPGDDSWLLSESLLVASQFINGNNLFYSIVDDDGSVHASPFPILAGNDIFALGNRNYAVQNGKITGVQVLTPNGVVVQDLPFPVALPSSFATFFPPTTESLFAP